MAEKVKDLRQDYEISKQAIIQDDLVRPELTLADKLKEKKATHKKALFIRYSIIGFLSLLSYGVYFLFKPFTGTLPYGICKTFLELNVPYPSTILLSEVNTTRNGGVRIWFTHIDSFGSYRLDSFICTFAKNEETGSFYLAEVKVGKLNIEPTIVERFNSALPYLIANKPDLTLPAPIPDSLEDIQFEIDRFRKPIFSTRR